MALAWVCLPVMALLGVRGAGWILVALIACHVFQAIWLSTEHTGLPHEGTILARTRTVHTSAFIRWWLWNMNYHAEHHAWRPFHGMRFHHFTSVLQTIWSTGVGYWRLQLDVLHQNNLPDGVRPLAAAQ